MNGNKGDFELKKNMIDVWLLKLPQGGKKVLAGENKAAVRVEAASTCPLPWAAARSPAGRRGWWGRSAGRWWTGRPDSLPWCWSGSEHLGRTKDWVWGERESGEILSKYFNSSQNISQFYCLSVILTLLALCSINWKFSLLSPSLSTCLDIPGTPEPHIFCLWHVKLKTCINFSDKNFVQIFFICYKRITKYVFISYQLSSEDVRYLYSENGLEA